MKNIMLFVICIWNTVALSMNVEEMGRAKNPKTIWFEVDRDSLVLDKSIDSIVVAGNVDLKDWAKLSLYPNTKHLSIRNVNECSFIDKKESWTAFFDSIKHLPIITLDLSQQFMEDYFLQYIPVTVMFLDLSRTSIIGYGLRTYISDRKMKVKITDTLASHKDFSDTSLVILK